MSIILRQEERDRAGSTRLRQPLRYINISKVIVHLLDMLYLQPLVHESVALTRSAASRTCAQKTAAVLVHPVDISLVQVKNFLGRKPLVDIGHAVLVLAQKGFHMV